MDGVNLGDVLNLAGSFQDTITDDTMSDAIDLMGYDGEMVAVLLTPGSAEDPDNTLDVSIVHCDTSGGSYTAPEGVAFAQVGASEDSQQKISLNKNELKRYVKFNFVVGESTTPSYPVACSLLGAKKYPA